MIDRNIRWYVVQTFAGAEWQSHRGLLARSIRSFFPHYVADARRGRWSHGVIKPRFQGYLFGGLENGQEAETVLKTPGVRDIIRNDGHYVRISHQEILDIREKTRRAYAQSFGVRANPRRWKVGDWVPVPHGPFCGIPAQIDALDKSGRIEASIGTIVVTFHVSDITETPEMSVRGR